MKTISSMHIIGSRFMGGAENFYARLIHALAEAGQPVSSVNRPGSEVSGHLPESVPQHRAAMRNNWDWFSRFQIGRLIKAEAPDLVQTYMGRATQLTHVQPGGPVHVARLGGYYKLKYFRHAHAWVGNTRGICDYLVRGGFPHKKVYHITNFIDVPSEAGGADKQGLRSSLGIPQEALVVLSMGRLEEKKGLDILLNSVRLMARAIRGRPVVLVILGDGRMRTTLHGLARSLQIEAQVRWPGWQADVSPYFAISDLFVCPSRIEPLGNVILEAWANGTPVLSTKTAGASELIEHGLSGWMVPTEDPEALTGAMAMLLEQPELCEGLAREGLDRVRAGHDRSSVVKAYLDLYADLTGK